MPHTTASRTMSVERRFDTRRAVLAVSGAGGHRRSPPRAAVGAVGGAAPPPTTPALSAALQDAVEAGAEEVWVDLSATTFMDSSGLHAIFNGQALASALGCRLNIALPPGPVRRLFDVTGYSERLAVHDALPPEE